MEAAAPSRSMMVDITSGLPKFGVMASGSWSRASMGRPRPARQGVVAACLPLLEQRRRARDCRQWRPDGRQSYDATVFSSAAPNETENRLHQMLTLRKALGSMSAASR
ncbi:hypothetical protein Areg01_76750 [Actinoplanes regularis]|nr:hypothetical protein Areg01_76750 [Actinoplanes regularis]